MTKKEKEEFAELVAEKVMQKISKQHQCKNCGGSVPNGAIFCNFCQETNP